MTSNKKAADTAKVPTASQDRPRNGLHQISTESMENPSFGVVISHGSKVISRFPKNSPVILQPNTKAPREQGWTTLEWDTPEDFAQYVRTRGFTDDCGLGVRLGNGLADVDLDDPVARRLAPHFLPSTPAKHGRPRSLRSHWWYCTDSDIYVKHLCGSATLVELRADPGHQTVIPPSRYPQGGRYLWDGQPWGGEAGPALVPLEELRERVEDLALTAALVKVWPGQGSRHSAFLALAGALLGAHWDRARVEHLVEVLAEATKDEEAHGRVGECVPSTLQKINRREKVTGWTSLTSLLAAGGDEVVKLGRTLAPSPKRPDDDGNQQIPRITLVDGDGHEINTTTGEVREPAAVLPEDDLPPAFVDVAALLADGLPEPPRPDIGHRQDGGALFYRGRVNVLFGDPESAKTLLALAIACEELRGGGRVLVVDADHNGADLIVRHLLTLGADPAVLSDPTRFALADPEDEEHLVRRVLPDVVALAPTYAVVDSVGELLPMLKLNSNDADDFTRGARLVLTPLARAGACVVAIDHLAKSADSRRSGATGTAAKKRAVSGASIRAVKVREFAPGAGGVSRLLINKDRPGGLRATSREGVEVAGERVCGFFAIEPDNSWSITGPASPPAVSQEQAESELGRVAAEAEARCQALLDLLTHHPEGLTFRQLKDAARGKGVGGSSIEVLCVRDDLVRAARDHLIDAGKVTNSSPYKLIEGS